MKSLSLFPPPPLSFSPLSPSLSLSLQLEVVNMYKYLGVYLTTRFTFSPSLNDLADRARKGTLAIMKLLWSTGEHSPDIFFKMFDCQIQPILTYGSEIWGQSDNHESVERVHLSALKKFLGVNSKSPRHLIYGETGRHPLFANTYSRCIKFWLRLTCMDDRMYPRKAYNMLLNLQRQNYSKCFIQIWLWCGLENARCW